MTAQSAAIGEPIQVTEENFVRAETDMYFSTRARDPGIGKLHHEFEVMPIENQAVIRANRDTLYSAGVFDLEAGPVTVTLPDSGKRFMSLQVIDEDHYIVTTVYAPGTFTFSKGDIETRYILLGIRTFVDPSDSADIEKVHALQDAIKIEQQSPGSFEVPNWDLISQKQVRDELIKRAASIPDTKGMFGARGKVDPERHLIGTATGWGGNSEENATYLTVIPPKNDGKTVHQLTVKDDVPVDGFWSISVYGADGYFHKNEQNSYSINNVTAKRDADGSVTIQFGGCDGTVPNCIPITEGWNYWVRLYRPRKEILDGTYKFPEVQPVS
ncbi:carboxylesterase [filamentous cyanobacterium CCP2]|nr:carboxylesterase [filamentous cyanobacterium CCP2]